MELLIFSISSFVNAFVSFALAIIVIFKSKENYTKILFLFYLALTIWSLGLGMEVITENSYKAKFWANFLLLGAIFLPNFYLQFVFQFFNVFNKKNKIIVIISYLFSFSFLLLNLNGYLIKEVAPIFYFKNYVVPQPLYIYFIGFFLVVFNYSFVYMGIEYFKKTTSLFIKKQLNYFFIALFIAFIGGISTYLPKYNIYIPAYLLILNVFYPIAIAYAILKHDLLDIKFVAKKIFSWTITIIILTLFIYIPIALYFKIWNIFTILFTLFAVSLVCYLSTKIIGFTNSLILKDFETRLQNLEELSTQQFVFNSIADFATHLTDNLSKIMNSQEISFFMFNSETGNFDLISADTSKSSEPLTTPLPNDLIIEYFTTNQNPLIKTNLENNYKELKSLLTEFHIEAIFPFFIDNKLMAFLTLGDSSNNYLYHKKEIKELTGLIKLKEHIFENTYLLEKQKAIGEMTQSLINLEDQEEFYKNLISFISRIFNISNLGVFVYDKETSTFQNKHNLGYEDDSALQEISDNNFLIKLIKDNEKIIKYEDLRNQSKILKSSEISEALNTMQAIKGNVIVPLVSTSAIGFIILGEKRIKEDYYETDLNFFNNIATIIAVKIRSFMIQEQSELDQLTKAYNRVSLDTWIHKYITWSKNDKKPLTFLFFDLDHFKMINDTKGHKFGDNVLKELSTTIKKLSRPKDMLFRIGGEEFVYILFDISKQESIDNVLDRIKTELKKGEYTNNLTLSIGQVKFLPNRGDISYLNNSKNIQKNIFRIGDDAVYTAKNTGRNKLCDGGVVEDKKITENHKWTLQIVANMGKYYDEFGNLFVKNGLNVTESNFKDVIKIFEEMRPNGFLCVIEDIEELEELKSIIKKIKVRSLSSEVVVVSKIDSIKYELQELSISRFFRLDEPKQIEDWAKVLAKNLE